MKKLLCAAIAAACVLSTVAISGCAVGEATVNYTLSEDEEYYIVSGVSGDKRGLTSYDVPAKYPDENGKPVKEIGDEAFARCHYLNEITLPDTVERIGKLAFMQCAFSEFVIPESVKTIDYGAFGMCASLTEITVPASVTELGSRAFYCCSSLETARINAEISVIGEDTFYNSVEVQGSIYTNTSLTKIYLPATLEKIHATAFYGNFLADIYFDGTKEQWDKLYFYKMEKKEGTDDEYEEKKYEKSECLSPSTVLHIPE